VADVAAGDLRAFPAPVAHDRGLRAAGPTRPPSRTRRAANARRSRPPVLRRWRGPPRSRPTPDPRASAPRAHADRSSGRRAPRRSPPPPAKRLSAPTGQLPSSAPSGTATVAPAPSRSVFERRILSTTPLGLEGEVGDLERNELAARPACKEAVPRAQPAHGNDRVTQRCLRLRRRFAAERTQVGGVRRRQQPRRRLDRQKSVSRE
jgi:hypothetical protein